MVDVADRGNQIETRAELDKGDNPDAAAWSYWMGQEAIAEKEERKWIKRAREIVKRYRDERPDSLANQHRFNILWSNVQTLKPTLYARTPKPDVSRRFSDPAQDTARFASMLLERVLSHSTDAFDFDDVMESVVEDRLLPGRGVARVLYVPHYGDELLDEEPDDDAADEDVAGEGDAGTDSSEDDKRSERVQDATAPLREVVYEEVIVDYVFWEDYREGPARKWKDVPWVRYRAYMTRDALVKRFGKEKGEKVNLDYSPKGHPESAKDEPPPDLFKKGIVHEYWDKTKKQAVWLAPGTPDLILDTQDDPLKLPDFYPSPNPLLATTTNDKRIPVPDYLEYQDQARELDTITGRIDRLTRALKVAGVYPGEEKQVLQQLIDEGTENRLIPVEDWQNWSEKGGLSKFIDWVPIKQIADTLLQLYDARDRVKQILYEITGIGDIMRGQTAPEETFGAQRLKTNFVTRRVMPQQKDVAKFARNILRLMAGVVGEHFSPKTISLITGYPQLVPLPPAPGPQPLATISKIVPGPSGPQVQQMQNPAFMPWQMAMQAFQAAQAQNAQRQQQFDQAVALLQQDTLHNFKVEIETDSTIAPDEEAEKAARTEFLREFIPLMQQIMPIAQGNPAMASLGREIALFGVRAFRAARPLEEVIEQAFDAIAKMPPSQQGGKGANGADSPEDLATRKFEAQSRAQTALQVQSMKSQDDAAKLGLEREKAEEQAVQERARLALAARSTDQQAALRGARTESIQAKEAVGLV